MIQGRIQRGYVGSLFFICITNFTLDWERETNKGGYLIMRLPQKRTKFHFKFDIQGDMARLDTDFVP